MPLTTLVDCQTLADHIGDPGWRVFDCRFDLAATERGRQAHAESHIPGAAYAHLDDVLSSPITADSGRHPLPDITRLCDWLGQNGVGPGTQVVVYDDTGGSIAVRLWWLLRWLGHDEVAVLDGGWTQWTARGYVTESTYPSRPDRSMFTGQPDWAQVMTTGQILSSINNGERGTALVDVRAAERFVGALEPIDPVPGHVPGAFNLPFVQLLDSDQCFLPAAELRGIFDRLLGDQMDLDIVAMCGSGVTACHALLALEAAGLQRGRLYAGSWSEWIRDPSRPVATGSG